MMVYNDYYYYYYYYDIACAISQELYPRYPTGVVSTIITPAVDFLAGTDVDGMY